MPRSLALRCCLFTALAVPLGAQEVPSLFEELSLEAAHHQARDKGGWVLLDAMTSWCGPCKQMDRTTWIDPRLEAWVTEQAVAIQLDMDEHEELKRALDIQAFPTIVLFREGKEFDRVVGLKSADEMLDWLGASLEGKRAKDTVLERLHALRQEPASGSTWDERAKLVADLGWFREDHEALQEYLWLWMNLPEQESPQRSRRLQRRWTSQRFAMGELVERHPPARAAFFALRAGLTELVRPAGLKADDASQMEKVRDWIELGDVTGKLKSILAWAEELSRDEQGLAVLRHFEGRLFDALVDGGAWRSAGLCLVEPVARTLQQREDLGAYDRPLIESAGSGKSRRSMPAIPMGAGLRKATKSVEDSAPEDSVQGESAKPGGSDEETKAEEGEANPASQDKGQEQGASGDSQASGSQGTDSQGTDSQGTGKTRKTLPAIPMNAGVQEPAGEAAKRVPMIPMGGGMRPAKAVPVDPAQEIRRRLTEKFRVDGARRYAALLAAVRREEARQVARIYLEELDDHRAHAALLAQAMRANAIAANSAQHQDWLDRMSKER